MRAVDTNLLIRLIARDDPRQAQLAERFVASGAWVSLLVLAECVWVLASAFALDRQRIHTAIEMLLQHNALVIERPDIVAAALAQFRTTRRVSFTDCLVIEIARAAGHQPVGTFDRALAKVDGAIALE
jgi:predicted nucleic-acid-binding protein